MKGSQKLNICMLLPLRYEQIMLVLPRRIGILSYLTHFGHQVTWIISSKEDHQGKELFIDGVKVYAIPYRRLFPGNSILANLFNQIIRTFTRIRFVLNMLREEKYDLIFVRTDVFDGLIGTYIRRRYRIPFVFELPNPLEEWELLKITSPKPRFLHYLIAKLQEFASKRLLYQADLILPISKWLENDLIKNKGISASKVMTVPGGVNSGAFPDRDGKQVARKYRLNDFRVVVYEGNLGKSRKLSLLIEAFSKVRMKRARVKLLMVGMGDDEEKLRKLADELGMKEDVIFTGRVPQSEIPEFIAAADVGVSPVPPIHFYKFSSPSKMFEYIAMAKPVVANEEIPEQKRVIGQSGGGILVPFTAGAFAKAIIELLDNPERAAEMGRRGREWVVKNRSYEVLARQVEAAYYRLLVADEGV